MKMTRIRCFWLYTILLIVLTMIPYFIGFESHGSGSVFTGFVFGVEDGNSYIAKMRLGLSGDWLFRTPYSSEPQRGVLAFLPYILLGKLAGGTELHLQLVLLFHLFRAAVIPLGVWATYQFADYFLGDDLWSAWATVLGTIGSGLGWLVFLFDGGVFEGSMPLGFISPETFGFLAYYGLPHLILARALLLLGLRWYLDSADRAGAGWKAGLAFALLGFTQPLAMVPAYAVMGVHQLLYLVRSGPRSIRAWRVEWLPGTIKLMAVSAPVFVYFLITFSCDPFLKLWTDQNLILSPSPAHYLVAYGLVFPFVLIGMFQAWSSDHRAWLLPFGWVLILPILAYAPYNLQRRLPEGGWIALVVLAAFGISSLPVRPKVTSIIRIAIVIVLLITPMLLIYGGVEVAEAGHFPAFRDSKEIAAFGWLQEHADKDSVVLASFQTGNAIPAWAPVHVVIGHGPETANLAELQQKVDAYYTGQMSKSEREVFLESQGVDYVFIGPREMLNSAEGELEMGDLQRMYHQGDYSIFRVVDR